MFIPRTGLLESAPSARGGSAIRLREFDLLILQGLGEGSEERGEIVSGLRGYAEEVVLAGASEFGAVEGDCSAPLFLR